MDYWVSWGFQVLLGKLILVGGLKNHLEKYEFVNGKEDIPYIMENISKKMKPPTSDTSDII